MTDTPDDPNPIPAYVRAAARLMALPLSGAQVERVVVHLSRTAALAATLRDAPLAAHDEPAQLYEPAPFPLIDPVEAPK